MKSTYKWYVFIWFLWLACEICYDNENEWTLLGGTLGQEPRKLPSPQKKTTIKIHCKKTETRFYIQQNIQADLGSNKSQHENQLTHARLRPCWSFYPRHMDGIIGSLLPSLDSAFRFKTWVFLSTLPNQQSMPSHLLPVKTLAHCWQCCIETGGIWEEIRRLCLK